MSHEFPALFGPTNILRVSISALFDPTSLFTHHDRPFALEKGKLGIFSFEFSSGIRSTASGKQRETDIWQ
jgi:hypothetical protein